MTLNAWLVSSTIATVAGPFGTFDSMDWALRGLFWFALIGVSIVLSLALAAASRLLMPTRSPLLRDAVVVLVFSLLFAPVVLVAIRSALAPGMADPISLPVLWVFVAAIAAAVSLILHQLRTYLPQLRVLSPKSAANSGFAASRSEPRLIRRLDGVSAADVIRLTVDDHYVVVVEQDGTEHRLLMRFSDAVQEMEGIRGYCIHRSHWVCHGAIRAVLKQGGREMVELLNGTQVPVSRTYRQNLVDAGLLEPLQRQAAG